MPPTAGTDAPVFVETYRSFWSLENYSIYGFHNRHLEVDATLDIQTESPYSYIYHSRV